MQYNVDKYAQVSPDGIVKFTHNGKIGNFKSADVMNKVKKYGDCLNVSDKGVELGILHINKLLFLDDKEVSEFVYKLIEYAFCEKMCEEISEIKFVFKCVITHSSNSKIRKNSS